MRTTSEGKENKVAVSEHYQQVSQSRLSVVMLFFLTAKI